MCKKRSKSPRVTVLMLCSVRPADVLIITSAADRHASEWWPLPIDRWIHMERGNQATAGLPSVIYSILLASDTA